MHHFIASTSSIWWDIILFSYSIQNDQYQFFFGEVLQKGLKVWVKCDYLETLHIKLHVHTSNLNTGLGHPTITFPKPTWTNAHYLIILCNVELVGLGNMRILTVCGQKSPRHLYERWRCISSTTKYRWYYKAPTNLAFCAENQSAKLH